MPDVAWAFSGLPQADPGGRVTPRFSHRLIRFRHFNSGSLALASLNHACWDHVPTFPQRSPPSLLTTAACGSLRSAPDCRTRRALLHLPYSCALPCGRAMLVTQDPLRTSDVQCNRCCRMIVRQLTDRREINRLKPLDFDHLCGPPQRAKDNG